MSPPRLQVAFWTDPLSTGERSMMPYSLGSRDRPAISASLGVTGAAFLSYAVLAASKDRMSAESARTLRLAVILQLFVFFVHPIVFGFQGCPGRDGR